MAGLIELQGRSEALFTQLLDVQTRAAPRRGVAAAVREPFSWFDPAQAVASAALAFRLSALSASKGRINTALEAALDHVEEEMVVAHPEQVRQGFALFVTHNRDGRRLSKPRTVAAAPKLFHPPGGRRVGRAISIGGASPGLDYWREDALANEHHQHWHEVYPYTGIPPRDFRSWVTETPQGTVVALLERLRPGVDWATRVPTLSVAQLAQLMADAARAEEVGGLPPHLYRALFRLNDRQGELFFYMHEQMLARYDAELLSHQLGRVDPYAPSQWPRPIPEGHDPLGLPRFGRREQSQSLGSEPVGILRILERQIQDALRDGTLRRGGAAAPVPIDRTNFGEAVESTVSQLRELDPDAYQGLHNFGHVGLAQLSTGPNPGVMISTVTAIRDQIFWRWHKHIDDLNAAWQEKQLANNFTDAPDILLRSGLAGRTPRPWSSPDIILCRTGDLPAGAKPATVGESLFGGDNWDKDFGSTVASEGGVELRTLSELTTTMATAAFGGRTVRFLTHEPFSMFLRVENPTTTPRQVTVRLFLVPADLARDRRAWIEMDKFLLEVPGRTKLVAYRSDSDSSVVKRPVDLTPARVLPGGTDPNDTAYCDCGWPYTLLLPRGTPEGLPFRLMAMCTDAAIDRVPVPGQCGSMSFCGAVDRYPDTREMGYPFARPFAGPRTRAISDALMNLRSACARTVTIRHA